MGKLEPNPWVYPFEICHWHCVRRHHLSLSSWWLSWEVATGSLLFGLVFVLLFALGFGAFGFGDDVFDEAGDVAVVAVVGGGAVGVDGGDLGFEGVGFGAEGFDGGEGCHGGEDVVVFGRGEGAQGGEGFGEGGCVAELAEGLGGWDADVDGGVFEGFEEGGGVVVGGGFAAHEEAEGPPEADGAVCIIGHEAGEFGGGGGVHAGGEISGCEDFFEGVLGGVAGDVVGGAVFGAGVHFLLGEEADVADLGEMLALGGAEFFEDGLVLGGGGEVDDFVAVGLEIVEFLGVFGGAPEEGLGGGGFAGEEEVIPDACGGGFELVGDALGLGDVGVVVAEVDVAAVGDAADEVHAFVHAAAHAEDEGLGCGLEGAGEGVALHPVGGLDADKA